MKQESLLSNVAWGVSSQILRSILSMALIPLVIDRLGTLEYGIFSSILLMSYSQGFLNQTDLGYPNFLMKYASQFSGTNAMIKFEEKTTGFFSMWILIQILIVILVATFFHAFSELFRIEPRFLDPFKIGTSLVLLSNFLASYGSLYASFLFSQQQSATVKKVESLGNLVFTAFAILGLLLKKDLLVLIIAFAISQVIQSIWLIIHVRTTYGRFLSIPLTLSFRFVDNWQLWKPFLFSKLNGLAIRQTDTAIVLFLGGPQFIAMYEIAMKIPSFLKVILGRVSESFLAFSGANNSHQGNLLINSVLSRILFFQAFVTLYAACGIFFYGRIILEAWLGTSVDPSLVLGFKLAALIPIVHSFCSSPGALLLGRDKRANFMAWVPTLISVLNITMSIPATYYWGFVGTIACTVIQFFISAIFLLKPIQSDFGLNLKELFSKIGISLIPIAGAQLFVKWILNFGLNRLENIIALLVTTVGFIIIFLVYYRDELFQLKHSMSTKLSV